MQCHELRTQLARWNASAEGPEHFAIVIDDGEAIFNKLDNGLLVSVELTVAPAQETSVEDLLRLAPKPLAIPRCTGPLAAGRAVMATGTAGASRAHRRRVRSAGSAAQPARHLAIDPQ